MMPEAMSAAPKRKVRSAARKRIRESGKAARMYNARRSHVKAHRWPNYYYLACPVPFEPVGCNGWALGSGSQLLSCTFLASLRST